MTITLDEMVRREVIHSANQLIADLQRVIPDVPWAVQKELSFDSDDLGNLVELRDYEEPVELHIANLDRGALIELLDSAPLDDEREEEDIRAAARREATAEGGNPELVDEDAIEELLYAWPGVSDAQLREKLLAHLRDDADNFENFANENNIKPDYSEVYEFWVVTDWLGEKLREKGHPVEEICGMTIWGRPTTGQHISMDSVIQQIYQELINV